MYKLGLYGENYVWVYTMWYKGSLYTINDTNCTPEQLKAVDEHNIRVYDGFDFDIQNTVANMVRACNILIWN